MDQYIVYAYTTLGSLYVAQTALLFLAGLRSPATPLLARMRHPRLGIRLGHSRLCTIFRVFRDGCEATDRGRRCRLRLRLSSALLPLAPIETPHASNRGMSHYTPLHPLGHPPHPTERTTLHLLPFVPPALRFTTLLSIPLLEHPLPLFL